MKEYKGYLLDLDGTIYRGEEIIPEALSFMNDLKRKGIAHLYVTNNSSATAERVAARLTKMGLKTSADEVYTSSMATAQFLQANEPAGASAYVIGEEGLHHALQECGFILADEKPRYVVVGIDRQFTYEKLTIATRAIRHGAQLVATNRDAALPSEYGLLPGNGSLVAAVSVASGATPIVIGKPEPIIVRYALERLGTRAGETLIVGDNLYTDIEAGVNGGLDSLLVLTGYSTAEEVASHPHQPTYIAENLLAWRDRLEGK